MPESGLLDRLLRRTPSRKARKEQEKRDANDPAALLAKGVHLFSIGWYSDAEKTLWRFFDVREKLQNTDPNTNTTSSPTTSTAEETQIDEGPDPDGFVALAHLVFICLTEGPGRSYAQHMADMRKHADPLIPLALAAARGSLGTSTSTTSSTEKGNENLNDERVLPLLHKFGLELLGHQRWDGAIEAFGLEIEALSNMEGKGPTHLDTLTAMRDLANVYEIIGGPDAWEVAETYLRRALTGYDEAVGSSPEDKTAFVVARRLGTVCLLQRKYADAERFLRRVIEVQKKGPLRNYYRPFPGDSSKWEDHWTGRCGVEIVVDFATCIVFQGDFERYDEAEDLFRRALDNAECQFGGVNNETALKTVDKFAVALREMGRLEEAERYFSRAFNERSRSSYKLGLSNTAMEYGKLYEKVGSEKYDEAEKMYRLALKGHNEMYLKNGGRDWRTTRLAGALAEFLVVRRGRGRGDKEVKQLLIWAAGDKEEDEEEEKRYEDKDMERRM